MYTQHVHLYIHIDRSRSWYIYKYARGHSLNETYTHMYI